MEKYGLDCRLHSAIYYLNIKGGLTAVDLLKALADDETVDKLQNSEAFKADFVDIITSEPENESEKIDKYVLEQLTDAFKSLNEKGKLDLEFYEPLQAILGSN